MVWRTFLSFSFAKWRETPFCVLRIWNFSRAKKALWKFPVSFQRRFFLKGFSPWNRPREQTISGLATAHLVCYYPHFVSGTDVIVFAHPKLQKWWPGWNVNIETYSKCQACQSSDSSQIHSIFFFRKTNASGPMCFSNSPWYSHQIRIILSSVSTYSGCRLVFGAFFVEGGHLVKLQQLHFWSTNRLHVPRDQIHRWKWMGMVTRWKEGIWLVFGY